METTGTTDSGLIREEIVSSDLVKGAREEHCGGFSFNFSLAVE